MPFKTNAARRHHVPEQRHRVASWAECDAGLRARGGLTVWLTAEAIEAWGPSRAPAGAGSRATLRRRAMLRREADFCTNAPVARAAAAGGTGLTPGSAKREDEGPHARIEKH